MENREVIIKLHKAGIEVGVDNNNLTFNPDPSDELMNQVIKYKDHIRNLVSQYGWPVIWRICLIEQEALDRGSVEFIKNSNKDNCGFCLMERKLQNQQICSFCIGAFNLHFQFKAACEIAYESGIDPNNIQQVIFIPPKR